MKKAMPHFQWLELGAGIKDTLPVYEYIIIGPLGILEVAQ